MVAPDGNSALTFNGELFHVEALRSDLQALGVVFRGTSDTEILMHALLRWGMRGTLERIEGQFAFAWYDGQTRELALARDRVGIRPLYYATSRGRLAIASEQKALLLVDWVERRPHVPALLRYLALERTDDVPGETLLSGVRTLAPGHWAVWNGRSLDVRRYSRIDAFPNPSTATDVRAQLESAVESQLVSDVPVGAFVSGGLDSSSVVMLADRVRCARGDTSVFSLFAYHDEAAERDEREYQRAVIDAFRGPKRVHWVSSTPRELASQFDRYLEHQEEPYGDVSSYAEFCIASQARNAGVKVLLSGLGGDEVFLGYGSYFGPLLRDLIRARDLKAISALFETATEVVGGRKGVQLELFLATAFHSLPAPLRNGLTAARSSRAAGLDPRLTASLVRDAVAHWHPHDTTSSAANGALRGSLESWSVPRFLAHSDRMTLAFGIEGRVPLLDDGVIRAAFGTSPSERVSRRGLKEALRRATDDVLPPLVRDRVWKLGFHAPVRPYVRALEARLRAGHGEVCKVLGTNVEWEGLSPGAQWRWGNLGCYLSWAAERRRVTTRAEIDAETPS